MNVHEHQAKELLQQYGIFVPQGVVVCNEHEIEAAISEIKSDVLVVKAQVHAGGRGKGGGVKVAKTQSEAVTFAKEMLGMQLITPQTGAEGKKVSRVYIEPGVNIKQELYLSLLLDRESSSIVFVASTEGGMDIELVAEKTPDKIIKTFVCPEMGFQSFHGRSLAFGLKLEPGVQKQFQELCKKLYRLFLEKDASLIEINPLVITQEDELIPLDAKMSFDDNGLFRHPDLLTLKDPLEEDPKETIAAELGLNYIALDGSIGCMVNGAGLAMATMDIIKLYGGAPANFLDVGGGATKDKVEAAFKLILSDERVRGVLVNIFGGIMRCDVIAEGIVSATKQMNIAVPIVVRLQGTNVDEGRRILSESGLRIIPAETLSDAAEAIVMQVGV
jgi:succinyl-CoA synthetase beta subunit